MIILLIIGVESLSTPPLPPVSTPDNFAKTDQREVFQNSLLSCQVLEMADSRYQRIPLGKRVNWKWGQRSFIF